MPMRTGTTSSNSMARNSPASAPGQGSRILPIHISCIPDKRIGESKSLKLYLFSCRARGTLRCGGFLSRGGLSIVLCCNYGRPGTEWKDMARYRLLRHDMNPEMVDNR